MHTASLILLVPGIIALMSYGPYIRSIREKITMSSYSTRFVLAVVNLMIVVTAAKAGAFNYMALAILAGSLYVTYVAFTEGAMWEWSRFDTYCSIACAILTALWLGADDPHVALFASLSVQLTAWSTTLGRLWKHPASQDPAAFSLIIVSALCQIAILVDANQHTLIKLAQPTLSLVIASIIVAIARFRAPGAVGQAWRVYISDLCRMKLV